MAITPAAALRGEVLRAVTSLPPHIVGTFEEPVNFEQSVSGVYYVFDRRGHSVHTVDPDRVGVRKAVDIGQEAGRILRPFGFDIASAGSFVVADVPGARQRIQTFSATGERLGGFFLPGQPAALISLGDMPLNGIGSIRHTGSTLLVSHPESGALFTEYSLAGVAQRSIGRLRETGFEADRDLHIAMNAGLALPDPTGGFFYVFLAGRPQFRKYDDRGTLVFERHIEGLEIDPFIQAQPTRWPRRRVEERELPVVSPYARAASVDRSGRLWISLAVPFTYVYDAQGDKVRTIQFSAAGIISPASLFFSHTGRLLVTPGCYEFNPE